MKKYQIINISMITFDIDEIKTDDILLQSEGTNNKDIGEEEELE